MAAGAAGDGKGILEFAREAGADVKDGALAAAKEVRDSVDKGLDTIKEIVTRQPAAPANAVPRNPQQITAILEGENKFLQAIGER